MAEWRLLRGWQSDALRARFSQLEAAHDRQDVREEEMTSATGWHHYFSESVIAQASAADDLFQRARTALASYQFSDPSIVFAHFDPAAPLIQRVMLLEIKVIGLHYLCPVLVTKVRDEPGVYGFRYDTLEGHIERGVEWFLLSKNAAGEIRFRIEARWRPGELPNWWTRVGFAILSGHYQRMWHRRAHYRMSLFAHLGSTTSAAAGGSASRPRRPDVRFTYQTKRRWFQ